MRFIISAMCLAVSFLFQITLLFPSVKLSNSNDTIILNNLKVLESSIEPGKFIDTNDEFLPYDGTSLKRKKQLKETMFTFKSDFIVEKNLYNTDLSLVIGPADYPYAIYLNKKILFKAGVIQNNDLTANITNSYNIYLSKDSLLIEPEINVLSIEIYTTYETMPIPKIMISNFIKNSQYVFWNNFFSTNLVQAASTISLIICLYFIFMFFAKNMKDMSYLYFALIGLSFPLGYLSVAFTYEGVNMLLLTKISRFWQIFASVFLLFFIMEFTGVSNSKKITKISIAGMSLITSLILFMQTTEQQLTFAFSIVTNVVLTPLLLGSVILTLISVIKNKHKPSLMILAGLIVLIITSLIDIGNLNSGIIPYCWLVPYGFLFLILCLFFYLSYEESLTYFASIKSKDELARKNKTMDVLFEKTSDISNNLVASSDILDRNIHETVTILKEYDKNNKEITEKILKQISHTEKVIDDISFCMKENQKIPQTIVNQTQILKETSASIKKMDDNIEQILSISEKTDRFARDLAEIAANSKDIVVKSKESIEKISEKSIFLSELLKSIEDIAEKTNLLSINASIESSRAGLQGKGFSVVAGEIRTLSNKSKVNLKNSFEKLNEMFVIINQSNELSNDVTKELFDIIEKSKLSSEMISEIANMVRDQKVEYQVIIDSSKKLLSDTNTIKDLSCVQDNENKKIEITLSELNNSFNQTSQLLESQFTNQKIISVSLDAMKNALSDNKKNVDKLKETILIDG